MTNLLMPVASHWAGDPIECRFKAFAGTAPIANYDGTLPLYDIPSGTSEVRLVVTPTSADYWEAEVTLAVAGSGALSVKATSAPFVKLKKAAGGGSQGTVVVVKVSRFKDVTDAVTGLLNDAPARRRKKKPGQPWAIEDVTEVAEHKDGYGAWPPPDRWNLAPILDAHFLDTDAPLTAGTLNFVKEPNLAVKATNLVLRMAGGKAPELFGVTWPEAVKRKEGADPTPFLVFFRQTNKGNKYDEDGLFVGSEVGKHPYPMNFDFADTGLFQSLHYGSAPKPATGSLTDPHAGPFYWPGAKGVPYQVAKAGGEVVTVTPCNKFGGEEYGVLIDTEETGTILEEIQAFMFWRAGIADPPTSIGRTAFAAFSSGNYKLIDWLGGTKQGQKNLQGNFLRNTLKAVYFLDPPERAVDDCIAKAVLWAAKASDARIRLYSQYSRDSHRQLLDLGARAKLPTVPYIESALHNTRTATALPLKTWRATFEVLFGGPRDPVFQWGDVHHIMPATMLTHALAQHDLK